MARDRRTCPVGLDEDVKTSNTCEHAGHSSQSTLVYVVLRTRDTRVLEGAATCAGANTSLDVLNNTLMKKTTFTVFNATYRVSLLKIFCGKEALRRRRGEDLEEIALGKSARHTKDLKLELFHFRLVTELLAVICSSRCSHKNIFETLGIALESETLDKSQRVKRFRNSRALFGVEDTSAVKITIVSLVDLIIRTVRELKVLWKA
mmetsp:Transcript_15498/g.30026  ORF Transcript_15498/g.30026 Transcript_15498/m.30026 type:complete len:205 (+) Transcript_15498:2934-3548(+)